MAVSLADVEVLSRARSDNDSVRAPDRAMPRALPHLVAPASPAPTAADGIDAVGPGVT